MPHKHRPFIFMDLPPEIREMIYHELYSLSSSSSTVHIHENEHATEHTVTINQPGSNMLRTCRTIHDEARHHLKCERLVFRTQVRNAGYEATESLPRLGQQIITGSLFVQVTKITVGATDLWRVVTSLGSLKARLEKLEHIEAIVVKRMPHRYWKERFPHIVESLVASSSSSSSSSENDGKNSVAADVSRACHTDSDRGAIPELELARFRCHVRSHPLINEDEHYFDDDDEEGYTEDRGCELFPRSRSSCHLADRGLRLHVCGRWILVDRRANNTVKLITETSFDLATGRIFDVRLVRSYLNTDESEAITSRQSLADLERQTVDEIHTTPA